MRTLAQRASSLVNHEVEHGRLCVPERCQRCQRECVPQAHHGDYSRPFDIEWLCVECHAVEHGHCVGREREVGAFVAPACPRCSDLVEELVLGLCPRCAGLAA